MGLSESIAPVEEPVSIQEFKDHARISSQADDADISLKLIAARKYIEATWNISAVNRTLILTRDSFTDPIELPHAPLSSVTSIAYVDSDGATQTLAGSVYTVVTDVEPGLVVLAYNQTWPATRMVRDAVSITFVAGFGASAANVPQGIKEAVMTLAAAWYEYREAIQFGATHPVQMHLDILMDQFRMTPFV